MRDFGGMVSFLAAGGEDAALDVVAKTRLFTLAESLGGVESLIEHPTRMTHASVEGSELAVDPALVRLSVGIETTADLVADLRGALDALDAHPHPSKCRSGVTETPRSTHVRENGQPTGSPYISPSGSEISSSRSPSGPRK